MRPKRRKPESPARRMKIGVISDTHGHFDPRIPELFAGVEHILHGGDIGNYTIVTELEKIAPVTAVLGNNDFGMNFRETELVLVGGRKFLVHHIVTPSSPPDPVRGRIESEQPDVVVFGHTHQTFCRQIGATLFFNPGYAGRQRFRLERSVAILVLEGSSIAHRFIAL